jgi:hypothetical protein
MAHCKLCNTNFSVAAGALYDVKRHAKRSAHVTAVEASSKTKSITIFVDKKSSSVILSETLFSNFVAEHNLPFSLADHFTKSLPRLCKWLLWVMTLSHNLMFLKMLRWNVLITIWVWNKLCNWYYIILSIYVWIYFPTLRNFSSKWLVTHYDPPSQSWLVGHDPP